MWGKGRERDGAVGNREKGRIWVWEKGGEEMWTWEKGKRNMDMDNGEKEAEGCG